jgi:hypothetical protein
MRLVVYNMVGGVAFRKAADEGTELPRDAQFLTEHASDIDARAGELAASIKDAS